MALIEEGDKVFSLYNTSTDWIVGGEYMFVTTQTAGEAIVVGMTPDGMGGYTVTAHDGETFTVGTDGNLYIKAEADHQIWTTLRTIVTDSGEVTTSLGARFYIHNTVYGKYLL